MHQTVRVSARLPFAQPGTDELAQDFAPEGERAAWMLGAGEDALVQQRVAVIVLGMHRSGTSAMARLLSLLGCALPATLMPGRGGNEHGHWESEAICAVNDALLEHAGSDWTDWRAVAAGWGEDWLARGRQVLRAEFGAAPLFVMKDPRQCRLLPFWLEVLARESVAARVVMALRHPWEVAQSLARRDGMSAARAHLLWLAHMLEGEAASRGLVRAVCPYDRVMAADKGDLARDLAAGLEMDWPDLSPRVLDEMADFVDAGARHHAAGPGGEGVEAALRGWAGLVFDILSRWAREGEDEADHAGLDAIAGAMAQAGPDLARLVVACEALERQVGAARGALAETQGALAQARGDLEGARGDLKGARGALAGALEWVADERAARDEQAELLAEREAGLTDLATLRDALIGERVMLIGQLEEAEAALARQAAEAGRLRREGGALTLALDTALLRLGQREGDLARMRRGQASMVMRLEEAEGWVLRLARERHGLERQAAAAARRMAAMERDLARATRGGAGEVTRLHRAMAEMTEALGEQTARVAGLEAQLAQAHAGREQAQERAEEDLAGRYGEIVALTRLLCEGEDLARQRACEAAWMRDVWAVLRRVPAWWRAMPMAVQRRWQEERLRRRGLFDARAYRRAHRDVAGAGIDPLDHYIAHGMAEGRDAMMEGAA